MAGDAEQAVREERDRAEAYFHVARVMLVVVGRDRCVSAINRAGLAMLACDDPAEVIGRDWLTTFIPETNRAVVADRFARFLAGDPGAETEAENPVLGCDGVSRLIAWRNSVLRDSRGEVSALVSSGEDITDRRANEERLRLALEAARLVTWEHDPATGRVIRSANAVALFGPGETSADFEARIHSDDLAQNRAAVSAAFAGMRAYRNNYRFRSPHGDWRYLEDRGRVLPDAEGRPARFVGVSFDQTELRLAEQRLRDSEARYRELAAQLEQRVAERTAELAAANDRLQAAAVEREALEDQLRQTQKLQAVGQLAGGVAHDFNNLLTAVLGSLELLERHATSDAGRRLLRAARMAAERGGALTAQLLVFARHRQLTAQALDAGRLLRQMEEGLRRTLGQAVTLVIDLAPTGWAVQSDPVQLELSMLNLALNARDAMPEGGTLTISTRTATLGAAQSTALGLPEGEYMVISAADTGIGMVPEVMARAFEPFFTTKEVGHGTGLGLAQVYGVARQSGGTALIESVPGQGTTVQIWLPRALSTAQTGDVPAAGHDHGAVSRILLVDDEEQVRAFAADVLREAGYDVIEAPNGTAALAMLRGGTEAEMLVTDFAMPGLTGTALAAAARQMRPGLRVLLISGYAEIDAAELTLADAQLRKPFRSADLRAAVARLLDHHPLVAPAVSPAM